MNVAEQELLSLLRTALWGVPADISLFEEQSQTSPDWCALFRLAQKQTVMGLIYDAALTLPQSLQPAGDLLRTAHLHTIRIAQSHQLLNATLAEIVRRLQAEGIRTVLLKGQGVALNYPNPLRRGCGDIDLYVGDPDYARACLLVNHWGMSDETATENTQHLHFSYNGVVIELHRLAGVMYDCRRNRLFRQWSDGLLQGNTCRTVEIGDAEIWLPPVRFNTLYIFYHIYKHFLTGGVGLRQFCDWALYLHTFRREIDREALKEDLQHFRLLHPWQVMGDILVRYLGLSEEDFPFYATDGNGECSDTCKKQQKIADDMMLLILQNGNFGFYNPKHAEHPDGYLAGKLHSFLIVHPRLWQVFPLCRADTLCYYRNYLSERIARLFKDTFTKPTLTGTAR